MNDRQCLLFLVSAPSGAGKTTVGRALVASNSRLRRVITCTTRPPREGETDGVDYHFLGREEFSRRVESGDFLEHAQVYEHSYGTLSHSVQELFRQGFDALLTVDVQGAAHVRQVIADNPFLSKALVTVFITPRSMSELERRLRTRGSDSDETIQRRLTEARIEIAQWLQFDYLILSDSREDDQRRIQAVYDAESLKSARLSFEFKG